MYLILDLFRGVEVEYDRKHKIITINKPMPVPDFIYLKNLLSRVSDEVKDIRLYADNRTKVRSRLWVRRN